MCTELPLISDVFLFPPISIRIHHHAPVHHHWSGADIGIKCLFDVEQNHKKFVKQHSMIQNSFSNHKCNPTMKKQKAKWCNNLGHGKAGHYLKILVWHCKQKGNLYNPTFSSSSVKPRPARMRVLYLNVGQRTTGLRSPATGRGAIAQAFFVRLARRLFLRMGWLNHVLTMRCQSLWKWPLGIMLFLFGAMAEIRKTCHS